MRSFLTLSKMNFLSVILDWFVAEKIASHKRFLHKRLPRISRQNVHIFSSDNAGICTKCWRWIIQQIRAVIDSDFMWIFCIVSRDLKSFPTLVAYITIFPLVISYRFDN